MMGTVTTQDFASLPHPILKNEVANPPKLPIFGIACSLKHSHFPLTLLILLKQGVTYGPNSNP